MQRKKPTAPETRPSERKPTAVKSSTKGKMPVQPTSLPTSQSKLEKGKANLKRLLKRIEEGENPYADRNSYRPGESQQEELKQEYTTNNVSSAYTTSLENINTKQQTFATNEQNKQECELKSIWAEVFEEAPAKRLKPRKFKPSELVEKERMRQRHNKSCGERFTSRKNLEVVRSAFNSLDSCKSSKSPKAKQSLKPKKKTKKPVTLKKTKHDSIKTSLTPSSMNTPRSMRSQSDALKSGPTTLLEVRSPKKKQLEVPYADFFGELALTNPNHLPNQQRKITEVSDQQLECSIVKSKTLKNNSFKKGSNRFVSTSVPYKKGKAQALRCLRQQIKNKIDGLYPTLKVAEKKLVCAVILIQRLWRQSKVKNIIGQFLTPKKSGTNGFAAMKKPVASVLPSPIAERSLEKSGSNNKQTPPKHSEPNNLFLTPIVKTMDEPRQPPPFYSRSENVSAASSESSLPSSKQQSNILKFVDSYRTMVLDGKRSKKTGAKPNFFSLTSSLSDKCLLGGMYHKIFSFGEERSQNSSGESKIHSKLMIRKNVAHPIKPEEVVAEPVAQLPTETICTVLSGQRFYTEVKQQEVIVTDKKPQSILSITDKKPQNKVETREQICNNIVDMLVDEFIEEFVRNSKKSQTKLKSKKKKLPGIKITKLTISQYLDGLIEFLLENYREDIVHNLNKIIGVDPRTLLRYMRDDFEDNGVFENEDEDEYCKGPVLCKQVFFDYQERFEKECFKISKDDEKYVNFIEGILKIHNKSLLDSFTESLDVVRIYGIRGRPHPWEWNFTRTIEKATTENLQLKLHQAKKIVNQISGYRLGILDRRVHNHDLIDEQNLLYSLRQDYGRDQHQWQLCTEEMLQVQLDLSNRLFEWLVEQAIGELPFS